MDMDEGNDPKYYQNAADKIKKEFQKMAEQQQKTAAQDKVEWESGQRTNTNLRGSNQPEATAGTGQDHTKFNTEVHKKLLKQQQLISVISSDSEQEDAGDDQIVTDKKVLNTDILSKKLNKIQKATKVVKEKAQTGQKLEKDVGGILSTSSSHKHKHHKSQKDHQDEGKDHKRPRGISPRNAIRVAFTEESSPESFGTPPEDPPASKHAGHTHHHHGTTTIDDSLPKNNFEGYGPTFYNNNVNPAISHMEIKKYALELDHEKDVDDDKHLFDLAGFTQPIPLKREIELCHLNSSFGGSHGLIAIADVKKGVTNIREGDPQMAKDTLTMVQLQLEKIGRTQEAILVEIKSEIDTLQSENLYLFQSNEKLKAQNNHLLERTVDLTKDLERLKRYVRVKQLEWEKISLIKSTPKSKSKAKGHQHSKKSKNANNIDTDTDTNDTKVASRSRRRQSKEKNQDEFYYDDDAEFDLGSKKSHKSSTVKSQQNHGPRTTMSTTARVGGTKKKQKQNSMKYEKETNCFSFLLGGGWKKKRADNDDDED